MVNFEVSKLKDESIGVMLICQFYFIFANLKCDSCASHWRNMIFQYIYIYIYIYIYMWMFIPI
jgi:hypothetical protein